MPKKRVKIKHLISPILLNHPTKSAKQVSQVFDKLHSDTEDRKVTLNTSESIYHRLIWDQAFKSDEFIIVYEDHIHGRKDISVNDFQPSQTCPWHRIWQYKYHDVVVWDREKRIDNIDAYRQDFSSLNSEPEPPIEKSNDYNQGIEEPIQDELFQKVGETELPQLDQVFKVNGVSFVSLPPRRTRRPKRVI